MKDFHLFLLMLLFGMFVLIFVVIGIYNYGEEKGNCYKTCKPYVVLICDSKHVVCDSLDGSKLIIFEE